MTDRPRLITAFSDARPFSEAANQRQYAHPVRLGVLRSLLLVLGWR